MENRAQDELPVFRKGDFPLNQKNNDTRDSRSAGLLLTSFFGANRSAWQVGDRTRTCFSIKNAGLP